MSKNHPTPDSELVKYIQAVGESAHLDFKAPIAWGESECNANLAKDIVAFSNSRDGGVIVIGKAERSDGKFEDVGVTDEQAKSFDTTRVATWINSKFSPRVELVCHVVEVEGLSYVVITIAEFADIPSICLSTIRAKKATDSEHESEKVSGKTIIQEGCIYVRNQNAQSTPLRSADDLRQLIALATRKRGDEMLKAFHAMLQGKPLVPPQSDRAQFDSQQKTVKSAVTAPVRARLKQGGWHMVFFPSRYEKSRFPEVSGLESLIAKHAVNVRDSFPPHRRGNSSYNWGIGNTLYGECWGLSREGLFAWYEPFFENDTEFKGRWVSHSSGETPTIPAGEWIDYTSNLFKVIEFFTFASRFATEFDESESIILRFAAFPIVGRKLVSTQLSINMDERLAEPAGETQFRFEQDIRVADFHTTWKDDCAVVLARFFELFPGRDISVQTLRSWVDRYLTRTFDR